jgi:hypothetical protein
MIGRKAVPFAVVAACLFAPAPAHATPRWVDRLLTLPGPVAGTISLGGSIAHADETVGACGYCGFTGTGISVEGVLGIANRVDIGLRAGFRGFEDRYGVNEGAVADADAYARMFDQLAYFAGGNGIYGDVAASNPELRVRVRILRLRRVFELGVEVRNMLPFAPGTDFTFLAGVPMALHLGRYVRFDFGGYTGFTFYPPNGAGTLFAFEAPAAFWFQVHPRVYLGPMFGLRWYSQDVYGDSPAGDRDWDFMLGFGLGVSCARFLDFQTQFYFPRINDPVHYVGAGAGVQFYFN